MSVPLHRLLLVLPPFTQLNTPYPSTSYLTGFLRRRQINVQQADLSLETTLKLFSRDGLSRLFAIVQNQSLEHPPPIQSALANAEAYIDSIEPVIRFLQGRDPTLAHRLCFGSLIPEGPRFSAQTDDTWAFGNLGTTDRARHRATLYLEDLGDLVRNTIDPHYGFSRYAAHISTAATSFDPLYDALKAPPTLIQEFLNEVLLEHLRRFSPTIVGVSVPFPGNLLGALWVARFAKQHSAATITVLGGGYVNTELRSLQEPRLFEFFDYVTLDDGERPLLVLLESIGGGSGSTSSLLRTFACRDGKVHYHNNGQAPDISHALVGAPTTDGLRMEKYLSLLDVLNPMHRLWSEGPWLKLTLAHGCYWKQCSFCDVSLDYIGRYESAAAAELVDRMEALQHETGISGFHFVDEAAPPLLLRDLALELLARHRVVSWWGNIRFDKTFSADLCRLLAASGCIAVSGGLEVASDRLLKLMNKGVSVAQVAKVAQHFTQAGVMVHAYLMYGFPTENAQEIIDSLERIRQLFNAGIIHSAFWHRFVATAHSPIGLNPAAFDIEIVDSQSGAFANNDLEYRDSCGVDADRYGPGLDRALYNFMQGVGLERELRTWFDFPVATTGVDRQLIDGILRDPALPSLDSLRQRRIIWVGGPVGATSKNANQRQISIEFYSLNGHETVSMPIAHARLLEYLVNAGRIAGCSGKTWPTLGDIVASSGFDGDLGAFLQGKAFAKAREMGLLLI